MKKCKIFAEATFEQIEKEVNNFLADEDLDINYIRFQENPETSIHSGYVVAFVVFETSKITPIE